MFGIGTTELLVILAVALIILGPKKLPDLAKSLGRAMGEFKRAASDLKQNLEQEAGLNEVRESLKAAKKEILQPDQTDFSRPAPRAVDDQPDAHAQENHSRPAAETKAASGAPSSDPDPEALRAEKAEAPDERGKGTV